MYIYNNEKNMSQAYKKSKQKEDIPIFNYTSNIAFKYKNDMQ